MPGARLPSGNVASRTARLVRAVRRARRQTQRELGYDLGVSEGSVANWEAGRCDPPLATCLLLEQWLRLAGEQAA